MVWAALIKNNLRSALSQWTDWVAYCPGLGEPSTESSVRWRDCLDENGTQIELYHCTFRSKLPSIESQNDAVDCPDYYEEDIGFAGMVYDLSIEYIGMKCPKHCHTLSNSPSCRPGTAGRCVRVLTF